MAERLFPMLDGKPSIPWTLAEEIYKDYAEVFGGDQSLERVAERGGFGYDEIEVFMQHWHDKRKRERQRGEQPGEGRSKP